MIVIFTANKTSGVLHYAVQMKKNLRKVVHFERKNDILPISGYYKRIANEIVKRKPKFVFACESRLISSRLIVKLSKRVNCYISVHDVSEHPLYEEKRLQFKRQITSYYAKEAWKACKGVVLLSPKSLNEFINGYPNLKNKCSMIQIGANEFDNNPVEPKELSGVKDYLLFFGTLEKYKGIPNLLKAYREVKIERPKLVIAGNGVLSQEEMDIIKECEVILIKRYIHDEEVVFLFNNCKATVLPYIEASQSGILGLSYFFGKPVIANNIEGIREYIEQGNTGFIYRNNQELTMYLSQVDRITEEMSNNANKYYKEHLSWDKNVLNWLKNVGEI